MWPDLRKTGLSCETKKFSLFGWIVLEIAQHMNNRIYCSITDKQLFENKKSIRGINDDFFLRFVFNLFQLKCLTTKNALAW